MRYFSIAGLCLVWASSIAQGKLDNSHSQFDYRGHHDQAAAKALGNSFQTSSGAHKGQSGVPHEAPRLRDRSIGEEQEPERWAQYVPEKARSIAVEISEARREARESETKRIRAEQEEEKRRKEIEVQETRKRRNSLSPIQRGVKNVKSATKKTGRRVKSKVQHLLEEDDDEEDDDDEEEDGEVGRRRRRTGSNNSGIFAGIWSVVLWLSSVLFSASAWSGRHLLWTPSTYVAEAIRWSAHTSWKTTRWTGERALVGPALTAGAPLIYLAEGLLFIFVFIPARILGVLARELYPI